MRPTSGYAILEECTKSGCQYWVRMSGPNSTTMIAASVGTPSELYADRAAAERDAEILRRRNARDVERNSWRTLGTEPATYTVIELTPWTDAEGIDEAKWVRAGERRDSPFAAADLLARV
jgi:hypothetical protein